MKHGLGLLTSASLIALLPACATTSTEHSTTLLASYRCTNGTIAQNKNRCPKPVPVPVPVPVPTPVPTPVPGPLPEPTPAPVPTPMPIPIGQVDILSPSIDGPVLLVDHDPETDLRTLTDPPIDNGLDVLGAYRQITAQGFLDYSDPILYPGQPGAAHLHEVSGALTKDFAGATPEKVIKEPVDSSANFTTEGHASQKTLYWVPAILDGHGNVVRPDYNSVYYKREPLAANSPNCGMPTGTGSGPTGICVYEPNGLRMIAGFDNKTSTFTPASGYRTDGGRPVYVSCSKDGTGQKAPNIVELHTLEPNCSEIQIVVNFPDCWDGKRLWAVDRSHMSYGINYNTDGNFRCPVAQPYHITGVAIHYDYSIKPGEDWGNWHLSSDMDSTKPGFYSMHGDVMLIWDKRVKDMRIAGCNEMHLNCSGGVLNKTKGFKGAGQPVYLINGVWVYSFVNPVHLTPVPPHP